MDTTTGQSNRTNDFDNIVLERRSVKVYNPEVKISREEMSEILAKASRAPSAINMQPWRFLVIGSAEERSLPHWPLSTKHRLLPHQQLLLYFTMPRT